MRILLLACAFAAMMCSGCCLTSSPNWKSKFDVPMNYQGREYICLHNLERLLDAKQEWSKDTGAGVGSLCPSPEVLAHTYFRKYEYGRRAPCDDDTQNLPVYQAICPSGGHYVIGTIGERPKCSVHGDLLRDYDQHIRVPYTH
jgi:hypothetical protein